MGLVYLVIEEVAENELDKYETQEVFSELSSAQTYMKEQIIKNHDPERVIGIDDSLEYYEHSEYFEENNYYGIYICAKSVR